MWYIGPHQTVWFHCDIIWIIQTFVKFCWLTSHDLAPHSFFCPHSATANEKSWVNQWTNHLVRWVVHKNFGWSDIKKWKNFIHIGILAYYLNKNFHGQNPRPIVLDDQTWILSRKLLGWWTGPVHVFGNVWVALQFYRSHLPSGQLFSCSTALQFAIFKFAVTVYLWFGAGYSLSVLMSFHTDLGHSVNHMIAPMPVHQL